MSKISVAIVDDNERMVSLLDNILQDEAEIAVIGHGGNGLEALDIIREKEPDVVLLDLIMPKLDGLEVMQKVNESEDGRKKPAFIVISAIGQESITEDAFGMGASYYIMKPFDNDVVVSRIKQARGQKTAKSVSLRQSKVAEAIPEYKTRNLETDVTNMIHEIITLTLSPLLVRVVGRLGPVMAGGAAAMDTCLPIIARYSGERYAILAVFSGMTLTLLVPVLVPALMSFR